ncbi:hypothetical protein LNGFDJGK_01630 [Enterobacter hormaechei]|nr:hypothetical protein LNGFDJGK_01630 [Enterobacter hormaechei]CQR76785.1 hypothetical protein BN1385_01640 [Enterobacter hormaechei]VAC88272.1 Uncharacterised protein [Enterobacter hormaechei]
MKLRIIKAISLSRFSPRWIKVICIQIIKHDINRSLNSLLEGIDVSNLTPEQKKMFQKCIERINSARDKRMEA